MQTKGMAALAALAVALTCQSLGSARVAAAEAPASPAVPAVSPAAARALGAPSILAGAPEPPTAPQRHEVPGLGFEAQRFGVPLSPDEQEQLEGYFWWSVAFGMMDALWRYASTREYRPVSWRYWGGMVAAAAIGGTVGAFSGGYANAVQAAGPLSRWASAGLRLYGYARTKILNEAIHRGQAYHWRNR